MAVVQAKAVDAEAFAFVSALAQDVSSGKVELPAIPDVAARVRKALEDDSVSAERLERIVSCEPVLASRIVQLANSAALNFSGRRVCDLRKAIARVGFAMVRTSSMAYALAQLRQSKALQGLEQPLMVLWKRSTLVAAMSRLVALHISKVNPDAAMFAGLLHGVGELYLLTRRRDYPGLLAGPAGQALVRQWQASVAKAILENWEIDGQIVQAVAEYENHDREHEGPVDLTDVLTVGYLLASYMDHPESLELNMADVKICRRLNLVRADYETLIAGSREQLAALREALDY